MNKRKNNLMLTFSFQSAYASVRIPSEVKALLFALQLRDPDLSQLMRLDDDGWTKLLSYCDVAHLTLTVAQLPAGCMPHWVAKRLNGNLADNALRFERVKATYREARAALDRASVEHLVIKGFAQSPDYVADPRLRAQSDIDVLCLPKCIETASKALQSIGYRPSDAEPSYVLADHAPTLVRIGNWTWRGNSFDPEMPLSLELHFCLWNEPVSQTPMPEVRAFWERRSHRELDGLVFPSLSGADQLAYMTLHILRNLFLRAWIIHHVRELAVFLNNHADDDAFWHSWSKIHSSRMRSIQAIAFYYARAWFNCRLHPMAAHEIDTLPANRRSWLDCFCGSALESMFRLNKDFMWLQLTLVPTMAGKWKILRRAFFPARIARIGVLPIRIENRRIVPSRAASHWQQYIAYLYSRTFAYARSNMATLARGFGWYVSRVVFSAEAGMRKGSKDPGKGSTDFGLAGERLDDVHPF